MLQSDTDVADSRHLRLKTVWFVPSNSKEKTKIKSKADGDTATRTEESFSNETVKFKTGASHSTCVSHVEQELPSLVVPSRQITLTEAAAAHIHEIRSNRTKLRRANNQHARMISTTLPIKVSFARLERLRACSNARLTSDHTRIRERRKKHDKRLARRLAEISSTEQRLPQTLVPHPCTLRHPSAPDTRARKKGKTHAQHTTVSAADHATHSPFPRLRYIKRHHPGMPISAATAYDLYKKHADDYPPSLPPFG